MNEWHDAEQRVERAQQLFAQRQWQEALEELRAAIAINPYNAAWHVNLGAILDELGRYGEAIDAYRAAADLDPNSIEARYRTGVDLSRVGLYPQAIAAFDQVERIDPAFEPAYCARIVAWTELGDHEKAEEMFYLARQYKEQCPLCYHNIALSLSRRRLFDRAIYCWQRTLDLEGSPPQVHAHIAQAYWEKGDLERARQHYLQELRASPGDTSALMELGNLLMDMGRVEEAGEKFRRAIELTPDEPAAHLHYGRWLLACDYLEAAWESLQRTLSLDPRYPGAQMHLGEICLRHRDLLRARRHLRAELRANPEEPRILMDLGNLLMECHQHRAAAACLKRLVGLSPRHAAGWQNLAVAQFMLGHFEQGEESCREALRCDPARWPAMYNLALSLEKRGRVLRSLAWLRRAMPLAGQDADVQRLDLRLRIFLAWKRLVAFLRPRRPV